MNPVTKDQAMWLTDVQAQFVGFKVEFKEVQRQYKEEVDEHQKEQPNFKFRDRVWFQRQHVKTTWPSKKLDH